MGWGRVLCGAVGWGWGGVGCGGVGWGGVGWGGIAEVEWPGLLTLDCDERIEIAPEPPPAGAVMSYLESAPEREGFSQRHPPPPRYYDTLTILLVSE